MLLHPDQITTFPNLTRIFFFRLGGQKKVNLPKSGHLRFNQLVLIFVGMVSVMVSNDLEYTLVFVGFSLGLR